MNVSGPVSGALSSQSSTPQADDGQDERRGLLYVAVGALFLGTSPVLVRWANVSLSSYEITAGRMLVAGLAVLGLAFSLRLRAPAVRDWPRFLLFGLIAAVHFGSYVASLEYTSISHSLALVYTAPIFVALFARLFLGEDLQPRQWIGIGVTVAGVAVLAGFEPGFSRRMLVGDLLALLSAVTYGLYSVAGRSQRDRYPLFIYAGTVYLVAAIWLMPMAVHHYSPGGYTWPAVASVVALGLVPLALGHTLYNAALRLARATTVNLVATQEVTGGILLGILFLGEIPSLNSIVGVLITLTGIALVILERRST